ncbi:MAG: mechanosensitive ion channel family protein, partial [Candidatus Krumholzibacteria bacterium]|nr:mechanosensitive ion channel family protein [Candidatus Krumholzibacteria bacterium]
RLVTSLVLRVLKRWAKKTATTIDNMLIDAIGPPVAFGCVIAGLYVAAIVLDLPGEPVNIRRFAFQTLGVLVIVDATWLVLRLVDSTSHFLTLLAGKTESKLDDQIVPIIRKSLKTFVGVLAFLFLAQNLGYSVASLLAGLGIGGLAVALALQDTLSNFFGSLTILIDRPFTVGDWIETDGSEGVVEEVGFRSTRIRTFAKTQISIPNSVLANSAVNNWSRMPIRRVKMIVGVTYHSSATQMEKAVEGIRSLLREHEAVYQDFFLVNFTDFGSSSLDIFVYYFTKTTVWADFLDVKQDVNLKIMRLLESLGMEIAFPSQTVYLKSDAESENPEQAGD